ncbi:hypothetical protein [Yoonia sp. MH D7]
MKFDTVQLHDTIHFLHDETSKHGQTRLDTRMAGKKAEIMRPIIFCILHFSATQ